MRIRTFSLHTMARRALLGVKTRFIGLADSLALERVRQQGEDYGRIRLWGSVTFALMSGALGAVRGRLFLEQGAKLMWKYEVEVQ